MKGYALPSCIERRGPVVSEACHPRGGEGTRFPGDRCPEARLKAEVLFLIARLRSFLRTLDHLFLVEDHQAFLHSRALRCANPREPCAADGRFRGLALREGTTERFHRLDRSSRMTPEQDTMGSSPPVAEWPFPGSAALGSSVRTKGIERELRARLAWGVRHCLTIEAGRIVLSMPDGEKNKFEAAAAIVAKTLEGIDALSVLPGEVEDILTISSRERMKWTKDGRLKSAGTRTVKLRGRAKAVTFHVFDPRHVEDVLDRDLPAIWRDEDAAANSENRKRAAGKAALTRVGGGGGSSGRAAGKTRDPALRSPLEGWESFAVEGLLR